jgi:cytoplasmic iron level regulating protein YaaA (DUF328/UPF0246 family)
VYGNGDGKEKKFDKGEIGEAFKEINGTNKTRSFFADKERGCRVGEHVFDEKEDEEQACEGV